MRFDYGHEEENRMGKAYDFNLFKRILPFARPHRLKLIISAFLVLAITLLELSIPYFTKEIIDRFIVPRDRIVSSDNGPGDNQAQTFIVDLSDPEAAVVVERHTTLFRIQNRQATIPMADLSRLGRDDLLQLRHRDFSGLAFMAFLFLIVVIALFVLTFIQNLIMELAGNRIMHDLRMTLYRHIQSMPLSFFNHNPVARLVTRVTNDIQNMHELFTNFISMVFKDLVLLIGIAAVLLLMDWHLALLTFLVLPLVTVTAFGFSKQVRDVFRDLRIKVAEINARFSETIGGIKVIQAFGREHENFDTFAGLNHANYLAGMRQINIFAVFLPIIEMLGITSIAIVIYIGGRHVLGQSVSIGVLAAFIAYMRMFFRPIRDLAEKYNILQNAMSSAERIFLLTDSPTAPVTRGDTAITPGPLETIRFQNVSLAYTPGEAVLKSIDLTIGAGQTVAIVGSTGSGKTSLVNLLVRFYDPTEGTVTFNGIDCLDIAPEHLRKRIALVMQDPFLFTGTLEDNIFFSNRELSQARREEILTASRCRAMVDRFPDGVQTLISEGGASLSSGERQLISVARAFAADAEVIILDEATSYVDSQTEIELQKAIANLMQGRTCVVVAHRLTTARGADLIVVLRNGVIVESGSHTELLRQKGNYHRLYRDFNRL